MNRKPVVLVSSLFYYKEELAREFVGTLVPQLSHARQSLGAEVRLVITLNFPFTAALWDGLQSEMAARLPEGVTLEYVRRGYNLGFGASHNHVFERWSSDVFVVMNNDLFCEQDEWLARMAAPILGEAGMDIVGVEENRTLMRASDACGVPRSDESQPGDFCDGSLLALKSRTVRSLGLFSKDYLLFYFEDSDLWLRYRQAGLRMHQISVPHRHLRSASSRQLPRHVLENILDINRSAFFSKWAGYMETRELKGKICLDLRAVAQEATADLVPAIVGLAMVDHPRALVDVWVSAPGQFSLLRNMHAWRILVCSAEEAPSPASYDRIWKARPSDPKSDLPPALQHLVSAGISMPGDCLRAFWGCCVPLEKRLRERVGATSPRAILFLDQTRPKFAGLVPPPVFFRPLVTCLREAGFQVLAACVGAQEVPDLGVDCQVLNSVEDGLALLDASDLFVGPATEWATMAQQMQKRCFVICGSKLGDRVIWDWRRSTYYAADVSCAGCHHVWGAPARAYCLRTLEACLDVTLAEECGGALRQFLEGGTQTLAAGMERSQSIRMLGYRKSLELDLSRWPED